MPDNAQENIAKEPEPSHEAATDSLSAGWWESVCAWYRDRLPSCDLFDALILKEGRYTGIPAKQGISDILGKGMWISLALVLITGIGLLAGYSPTTGTSYPSAEFIQTEMPFGWWLRGVHKWGTDLFLILALLRLLRMAYRRAYKKSGEFAWLGAMGLIVLACVAGLTGYLLVWNQQRLPDGSIVGLGIPAGMIQGLFPGVEISQNALTGVYTLHLVLGFIAMALVVRFRDIPRRLSPRWRDFSTYIPPAVTWTVIGFLTLMSLVFPPPLGGPSDGLIKPGPIFSDWFFLPVYGVSLYSSHTMDLILLGISFLLLCWIFLPFVDKSTRKGPRPPVNQLTGLLVLSWLIFFLYGFGVGISRTGLTILIVAVFLIMGLGILMQESVKAFLARAKSETEVKDS